jgi:hypothetical protein
MTDTKLQAALAELKRCMPWLSKLAADHDGDYIADSAMRQWQRCDDILKANAPQEPDYNPN